uniref:Zgc:162184 n=1 Tax=Cyprinus carpio TaxID=7962 RepID=A0A8C2GTF6_CYPCA
MPPPRVNKKPKNESTTNNNAGTLDDPLKFLDQDYQELKKSCITDQKRFVDDKFPPDSSSIDPKNKLKLDLDKIEWLRPSKIVSDPQLIVQGVSRFDYSQGSYLGNCWFLASVGALTFQKEIMDQVMPADQSFGKDYAGIFHFRFWRFGKWIDVVIDDKLPTIKGKLIFVHSKTSNEFWPALLEKAYAKVCGSYADMHAGRVSEALLDFTGGVHICLELEKPTIDVWSLMDRAAKNKALMACGSQQGKKSENILPNGIVQGHAYTVTGVLKVTCQEQPVRLVRVLNPWGRGEWNGAWSDNSSLWNKVSEKELAKCRSLANDGEFWMSMEDFTKNFEEDSVDYTANICNMKLMIHDSFCTNPQFRVRIEALDEECASGQCPENILVSLMQIQENRYRSLVSNYSIGFDVYLMKDEKLPAKFFYRRRSVEGSGNFINTRHVMKFFKLEPGEYLIVPSTFNPNECAKFMLSIFTKTESHTRKKKPARTYV